MTGASGTQTPHRKGQQRQRKYRDSSFWRGEEQEAAEVMDQEHLDGDYEEDAEPFICSNLSPVRKSDNGRDSGTGIVTAQTRFTER